MLHCHLFCDALDVMFSNSVGVAPLFVVVLIVRLLVASVHQKLFLNKVGCVLSTTRPCFCTYFLLKRSNESGSNLSAVGVRREPYGTTVYNTYSCTGVLQIPVDIPYDRF